MLKKTTILTLILPIAVLFTLTECTFETSDNGDLDGYWQLTAIDTLATAHTADMRHSGIYWAVQVRLLLIRDVTVNSPNVLFRFEKTAETLTISNPVIDERDVSDIKVENPDILHPYGIYRLKETFRILQLDSQNMVLENQDFRMHFRKY